MSIQDGKVILISGGMGGVGSAVAQVCVDAGYRVVILYHRSSSDLIKKKKQEYGDSALFLQCDLQDLVAVQKVVEEVINHFGGIDICVHTAVSNIVRKPIMAMDVDEFKGQFETGLFGAFNLFSAVVPSMKVRRKGMLIGITSAVLEVGGGGARMGAYVVAKFALRGLLRELQRELKADGIGVYAVAPDLLKTALTNDLPDAYFAFAEAATSQKALMTPGDVARAVMTICEGSIPAGSSLLVSTGEVAAL